MPSASRISLDGGGHVLVLARRQPRALLDDAHPGTEAAVHLGELESDVAAADDHQVLGQHVEVEDPDVGQVVDVGQSGDVGGDGATTDVEEDPVGLQHLVVDPDRVRALEAGVAADQRAAVHPLEPGLDAVAVIEHDPVLARLDLCHVDRDVAGPDMPNSAPRLAT